MTTELTTREYNIPASLIGELEDRIAKINRRAAKLGSPAVSLVQGETFNVRINTRDPRDPMYDPSTDFYMRPTVKVTVTGEAPMLGGWAFAATIQHEETEAGQSVNILRKAPGFDQELPEHFRTASPEDCDHCHTRRARRDTYIVYSAETESFAQVGSNCLGDFTGAKSPHAVAAWLEILLDLESALAEMEDDRLTSRGEQLLPLEGFVSMVAAAIREYGWLSRSKAREMYPYPGYPTADRAADQFGNASLKAEDKITVTEEDKAAATAAIAWAREEWNPEAKQLSDYEWTMYVVLQSDWIGRRHYGFAASVINAHRRATEKALTAAKARENKSNEWVAEEGAKLQTTVTLMHIIEVDGFYGLKLGHVFEDENGNCIMWWAAGAGKEARSSEDVGKVFQIKASVKELTEYQGRKQTVITRAKLTEVEAVSA